MPRSFWLIFAHVGSSSTEISGKGYHFLTNTIQNVYYTFYKCELFAPRANKVAYKNANVTIEAVCDYEQAVENKTFLVNFAIEEVLQEQTVTMTDFVFSMCFSLSQDDLVQVVNIIYICTLFLY